MHASLLLVLLPPTGLWVVDDNGGPGVDFTALQAAVDAAADGDVILVRAGTYGAVTIDGKGVSLVGDLGASVIVQEASVHVLNLAPGQDVLLQNLEVRGDAFIPASFPRPALEVLACQGLVSVQDCRLLPDFHGQGGGAVVEGSSGVAFARSTLRAGARFSGVSVPAHALRANASSVAVYDSLLLGSSGFGGTCSTFGCGLGLDSGDGANLDGAFLFASGSTLAGGQGQDGDPACLGLFGGEASDGGDGARLLGGSDLRALECTFTHGLGGMAACGSDGADGQDVHVVSGTYALLYGPARSLDATSPIHGGDTAVLTLAGEPGDLAFLLVSLHQGHLPQDPYLGMLLVDPGQFSAVQVGAVPGSGTLDLSVGTLALPGPDEAVIHHLQSAWLSSAGEIRLGSQASVVLLQ